MRTLRRLAVLLVGIAAVVVMTACGGTSEASTPKRTVISIHFSHFQQDVVTAKAGQPIYLMLQNNDPIDHEWIVGTEEVHEKHRNGTDGFHNQIPTEVTIPALSQRPTVVRFDVPGDYAFICHLPGHEAYGMKGILRVEG